MTPEQKHDLAEYLATLTSDDWFWYDWEEDVIRGAAGEEISEEDAIAMLEKEIETAIRAKALLDEIGDAA